MFTQRGPHLQPRFSHRFFQIWRRQLGVRVCAGKLIRFEWEPEDRFFGDLGRVYGGAHTRNDIGSTVATVSVVINGRVAFTTH